MGFPGRFLEWVGLLYRGINSRILENGRPNYIVQKLFRCVYGLLDWWVLRPSTPKLALQWQCNSLWVENGHNLLDCPHLRSCLPSEEALNPHHAFDAGVHPMDSWCLAPCFCVIEINSIFVHSVVCLQFMLRLTSRVVTMGSFLKDCLLSFFF